MFLEWESNSGKLQIISRKFQNNAINDVQQISLSHVICYHNTCSLFFIIKAWVEQTHPKQRRKQ